MSNQNSSIAMLPSDGTEPVTAAELQGLARGLLKLAERLGTNTEELRAQRLLLEVSQSWPGTISKQWWKWLVEAGRSLDLDLQVGDVSERDLRSLVTSGSAVIALSDTDETLVFLESIRGGRYVAHALDSEATPPSHPSSFNAKGLRRVVYSDRHQVSRLNDHADHEHPSPTILLWRLVRPEWKDLLAVIAISGIAGLLLLSVPVTAQQLVRTVTFASLYQPIVVLSLILLGLLGFVASLIALQTYVAEIIQRRLFVRVAGVVSRHLPRTSVDAWKQHNATELMNRFLDVVIVQKVVAALLVDGVAIVLSTLIGMSVMAFYHPFLLGYDVVLLMLLTFIVFVLGRGGVNTAIGESRAKYEVLAWLEDVARCPSIFQSFGASTLAAQRTDALCTNYLKQRRAHFRVLLRQIISILCLQAFATTTLLGLGGYLVLQEQLTLGQLVAAELIVATIVASFAKMGKQIEGWYDVLAAVEKLSHLTELPLESSSGLAGLQRGGPAELEIRPISNDEPTIVVKPGSYHVLSGWDEIAIRTLREALQGARTHDHVSLLLDGVDFADFRPDIIRAHVTVLANLELLPGSIAENIHIHRPDITDKDVLDALELVDLNSELRAADLSVKEKIQPSGWPLTESQSRRLLLARGLAGRPRLLVLDRTLDELGDVQLEKVVPRLKQASQSTTLLVITNQARVESLFAPVPN